MLTQRDLYERAQTAETPRQKRYWFSRALASVAGKPETKWFAETQKKPKEDLEHKKAYLKVYAFHNRAPKDKKDLLSMAYKAYHAGNITKRQARKLGCNIQ